MQKKPHNYEVNELLMGEWQKAYRIYNGKPAPPIHYENGWFIISSPGFPPGKHRRSRLMLMIDNLNKAVERRKQDEDHLLNGSAHQGSEPGQSS